MIEISSIEVIAAVSALIGAIALLYKTIRDQQQRYQNEMQEATKQLNIKLDKCEDRHEAQTARLIDLAEKVGQLRGLEQMSDIVLKELRKKDRNE